MIEAKKKIKNLVAIDFDGTITDIDVVDGLLVQFADEKKWIDIEKQWSRGEISSKECMEKELEHVKITEDDLHQYLKTIELDPGFRSLKEYLDANQVPFVILSDGFDLFIENVLANHGFHNISFRSNILKYSNGGVKPEFPFFSTDCNHCGHCKKKTINEMKKVVDKVIFIGDGMSDRCALQVSDHIFAKNKLKKHCDENKILYRPYTNLNEVKAGIAEILETPDIKLQA